MLSHSWVPPWGLFHMTLSEPGQTIGCKAKPINVRSVSDRSPRFFDRTRKISYQGRNRHDLITARHVRIFQKIDHFDLITALHVPFT